MIVLDIVTGVIMIGMGMATLREYLSFIVPFSAMMIIGVIALDVVTSGLEL
jgi:hypothetical protein